MARGGCDLGRSPPLAPLVWKGEVQAFPRREAQAVAMRMPRLRSSKLRSPIRAFAVERLTHDCPADLVLRRSRPRHLYARPADTAQSVHPRTPHGIPQRHPPSRLIRHVLQILRLLKAAVSSGKCCFSSTLATAARRWIHQMHWLASTPG